MRLYTPLAIATTSLSLCFAIANSAQSATIAYDFSIRAFSAPAPFSQGYFSFETPTADFSGDIPVKTFNFNQAFPSFTEIDKYSEVNTLSKPVVKFESGIFKGLFFTAKKQLITKRVSTQETYIAIFYSEADTSVKISGNLYDYDFKSRICNSIYPLGTVNIDPANGNCAMSNRRFKFDFQDNVIYSLRSIPESNNVWGLTALGFAWLLRRNKVPQNNL